MAKKVSVTKSTIIISVLLIVIAALSLVIAFFAFFYNKIYPGIYVNGVSIGGLSREDAAYKLKGSIQLPEKIQVTVNYDQPLQFDISLSSIDAKADYNATVAKAYAVARSGREFDDVTTTIRQFLGSSNIDLAFSYDDAKLNEQINIVRAQSPKPPRLPSLKLNQGQVEFVPGEAGVYIDSNRLKVRILEAVRNAKQKITFLPQTEDPTLSLMQSEIYIKRGVSLANKSLVLTSDSNKFVYESSALLSFLHPSGGYYFDNITPSLGDIEGAVKSPPTNPVFIYSNGRVQEFSASKDGLEVEMAPFEDLLVRTLTELETSDTDSISVDIPVKRTPPDFSIKDVNDLGISELIGVGTSSFRGSIASRAYNISLAASRLNGVLIKPGEVFSFVNTLGDISTLTGYKQAYVIQGDQTILGDGGGVCQVSTTFFRAALNAGLPIVERHAHSYRVGYYEQDSPPGIDATIYHPTVDIKIKNDTPGHILIQTFTDLKNSTLRFEFYGTSDGRVSTIGKPVVSEVTPPPDDLYTDDPTLPTGQVKQIDYKAWGAKVRFSYTVERNGETIFKDTFYSNYRPWQAKYLRGTGPAQ